MRTRSPEEIVINGVRYHLSIRLETLWNHHAEWWSRSESHAPAPTDRIRSASDAERQASQEIQKARLTKEPWLCAEIAGAEVEEALLHLEHND